MTTAASIQLDSSAPDRRSPIKTFRDLLAWQRAMDLVVEIYEATRLFPKDEQFGLTAQVRRAVVSVPCNLAEGYARRSRPDYVRFIQIAAGSLSEVQTQLQIAHRLKFLPERRLALLEERAREVEYLLTRLREKLLASPRSRP